MVEGVRGGRFISRKNPHEEDAARGAIGSIYVSLLIQVAR